MKCHLVMVGRTDESWLNTGLEHYLRRIERYTPFQTIVIPDIKRSSAMPDIVLKEKEGEVILKLLSPSDIMVLLDERGMEMGSRGFADFLNKMMLSGCRKLFFVIGGAYGFSDSVYKRADHKLSLSRMTFPHQLVRLVFAEQLYRAFSILNNEPYHHD